MIVSGRVVLRGVIWRVGSVKRKAETKSAVGWVPRFSLLGGPLAGVTLWLADRKKTSGDFCLVRADLFGAKF